MRGAEDDDDEDETIKLKWQHKKLLRDKRYRAARQSAMPCQAIHQMDDSLIVPFLRPDGGRKRDGGDKETTHNLAFDCLVCVGEEGEKYNKTTIRMKLQIPVCPIKLSCSISPPPALVNR